MPKIVRILQLVNHITIILVLEKFEIENLEGKKDRQLNYTSIKLLNPILFYQNDHKGIGTLRPHYANTVIKPVRDTERLIALSNNGEWTT